MKQELKQAFNKEIAMAKQFYRKAKYKECFFHLEKAHILGQSYVIPHTTSHWWMLKAGWKTGSFKEVLGQVMRIMASLIFSRIWVPKGNTGGVNVSALKPMPLPDDLKKYLN